MSEYPMIRADKVVTEPDSSALFDSLDDAVFKDDEVEHVVDTRGVSYDQARRIVGVEARQYESPTPSVETASETDPNPGVSVSLGARAVAIQNIMHAYNHANKTAGAALSYEFADRYQNSSQILRKMENKEARLAQRTQRDYDVLTGRAAFLAAGAPLEVVDKVEQSIIRDLRADYGPGHAYSYDREKVIKKVNRAVKNPHSKAA